MADLAVHAQESLPQTEDCWPFSCALFYLCQDARQANCHEEDICTLLRVRHGAEVLWKASAKGGNGFHRRKLLNQVLRYRTFAQVLFLNGKKEMLPAILVRVLF